MKKSNEIWLLVGLLVALAFTSGEAVVDDGTGSPDSESDNMSYKPPESGSYSQFDTIIQAASNLFVVPMTWIKAVIGTESSFNPTSHNAKDPNGGSFGLMGMTYGTAKALGYAGDASGLYDPNTNIYFGTKLLGQLRQRWGDDFNAVYSAYNSGSGTAYRTSTQVASHVQNANNWLALFLA